MTEPEIARRCPSCGASIRVQAFFCPQCGKELTQPKSGPKNSPEPGDTVSIENLFDDTIPIIRITSDDSADAPERKSPRPPAPAKTDPRKEIGQRERGDVGARIQRATSRARDVEGDVIHRVQKLREISSVVMEEASYDPSLRFVLVAAALFALFLVILILNKLIG
jgi:hypothetical protein